MKIEVPQGVRYTCLLCGDCCRPYAVLLGPGEKERIDALDWTRRCPELAGVPTTEHIRSGKFQGKARLRRRADGACLFLDPEDRCLLHEHFGGEVKPLTCRMYPFDFVGLGERACLDVSFSCRAIADEHGEPLDEHAVRREVPPEALLGIKDRERHRVTKTTHCPPEILWDMERILLDFLADRSMAMDQRIRCVVQFLSVGTSGRPDTPVAAEFREAMVKGIRKQAAEGRLASDATLDRTQRAFFFQWLYLALNPIPESFHDQSAEEQAKEQQARLERGERFRDNLGRPWVENRQLGCDFARIADVDASLFRSTDFTLPGTYLRAKILGQRFLRYGGKNLPVVEGTHRFLLNYPMMVWTAKAMAGDRASAKAVAGDRGAGRVEEADVRAAIRALDRFAILLPHVHLPLQMVRAWEFLVEKTDLVMAAVNDMLQ